MKTTTQWAGDMLDGIGDELDTIRTNVRALVEALAAKEAENAELLATLANERGEGEPPCEGWEWQPGIQEWRHGRHLARRNARGWGWEYNNAMAGRWVAGDALTARAAMRAASSQGADVPKEQ